MRRTALAASIAVAAAIAALTAQTHVLPPGHVDSFAGDIRLWSGTSPSSGIHYIAVGIADTGKQFIYQLERPVRVEEARGAGTVEYWHDGLRVSLPTLRRVVELRLSGRKHPKLPSTRLPVTRYSSGYGLVERTLPRTDETPGVGTADYCPPEYSSCGFDDDPIGGGGSGAGSGGSCDPKSCSVTCSTGSCSASCNSGYKAACSCNQSYGGGIVPFCQCIKC